MSAAQPSRGRRPDFGIKRKPQVQRLLPVAPAIPLLQPDRPFPRRDWYAALTNPRCEFRARDGLLDLGCFVFMPLGRKWSKPRRSPEWVERVRPAMPGYVFLSFGDEEPRFWSVRKINGVRALVCGQRNNPVLIGPEKIDILHAAQERGLFDFGKDPRKREPFEVGSLVQVIAGVLQGQIFTVKSDPGGGELFVEEVIFGSRMSLSVDLLRNVE